MDRGIDKDVDLGTHLPVLRRYAARLARGRADIAEDLVQETCARALGRSKRLAGIDNLQGYLLAIMHNLFADTLRQPVQEIPIEICDAAAPAEDPALRRDLRRAIARLPGPQARALVAHLVEGLSYAEIADRDGIAPGTVMSRIARGRAALRAALDG